MLVIQKRSRFFRGTRLIPASHIKQTVFLCSRTQPVRPPQQGGVLFYLFFFKETGMEILIFLISALWQGDCLLSTLHDKSLYK